MAHWDGIENEAVSLPDNTMTFVLGTSARSALSNTAFSYVAAICDEEKSMKAMSKPKADGS